MARIACALLLAFSVAPAIAQDYGHIKGKFVFNGKVPELPPIIGKGMATKDPTICAAKVAIPDPSFVVDENGGIGNVFIYLREAPETIHPKLVDPPKEPVPFGQEGCIFEPHALFTRVGQGVNVGSSDACSHNTHTFPIKNEAENFLLPPNPPKPTLVETPKSEILPITVKCDIHPWMTAYWLILDHPYATVSKADGTFTIENLPVGDYSFRVWHEKAGYLERSLKVTVVADKTVTVEGLEYDEDDFDFDE